MGSLPRQEICRHQALRPRRRRSDDPRIGSDHQIWRPVRRPGHRLWHGASRATERPRQRAWQTLPCDLPRIPGRQRQSRRCRRFGRRQIPSRHIDRSRVRRQERPYVARPQPVASRGGRSRRARQGARAAGAVGRHRPARQVAPRPDPWRRRLCRPGHRLGVSQLLGHPRLQHRRLHPFHRQQPDRFHDQPAVRALFALSERCRQGRSGADPPRQWR